MGEDFAGFLMRDGWSVYRQFQQAFHQSCVAHLLRRCREMMQVQGGSGTRFPRQVQKSLQAALEVRQCFAQGQISERGLAVVRGRIEAGMDRLLDAPRQCSANQRLSKHLSRERDALFTFLYCPGLEATNWKAEQAIRPMVVTRKVWGGNRTAGGAHVQSILLSVLTTCRQQNQPILLRLQQLLCAAQPKALNLLSR